MDIVNAYVTYCSENEIDAPTVEMQKLLRENVRDMVITDANIVRVHNMRLSLVRAYGSEIPKRWGDRFDTFCKERGRVRPTPEQINAMNLDPFAGAQAIRNDPTNPRLYRALATFRAYGGF